MLLLQISSLLCGAFGSLEMTCFFKGEIVPHQIFINAQAIISNLELYNTSSCNEQGSKHDQRHDSSSMTATPAQGNQN